MFINAIDYIWLWAVLQRIFLFRIQTRNKTPVKTIAVSCNWFSRVNILTDHMIGDTSIQSCRYRYP